MKHPIAVMAFVTLVAFVAGSRAADPCAGLQVTIGPGVPHDVPGSSRLPPTAASDAKLAAFAWQQFLALCWQSDYDTTSFSRGAPDTKWNFSMAYKPGQPLVWETYAHRSELRPSGVALDAPFNKQPLYLFGNMTINPDPPVPTPIPDQPVIPPPAARFDLFNNLDEDSEIGSCNVYLGPKEPSKGDPKTQPLVLYQAKVNQAEYDYIKSTFGETQFNPNGALAVAALANKISIKNNKVPATNGINLPAGDNSIPGPKGEGTIEIKTAFLLVTDENKEQLKDFFQTQAIYYTADYDATKTPNYSNWKYHNGTFALLAIHVIHKTKSYPDFIFTSFEHKSLAANPFQFILTSPPPPDYPGSKFNPFGASPTPGAPSGSQFGTRHLVERQSGTNPTSNGQLYPIPSCVDAVTETVHGQLSKLNPNSIWLNYRLMGVQANITEKWAAVPSEGAGPNHFMANHVVESDGFLGNFFGPGFGGNPFPTGPKDPKTGKQNGNNVLYQRVPKNMGGCKGCHGVAQTSFGTDFSFLLDSGNDKPVVNPDTIFYHPDEQ
jgi:hypothetical protein